MTDDIDRIIRTRVVAGGLPLPPRPNPWRLKGTSGLQGTTNFGTDASVDFPTVGGVPALESLNYYLGDIAGGGQSIVATGTNCAGVTAVNIWGGTVTPDSTTSTTVTFTLPAHAAGSTTVSLTGPGGTSGTLAFESWSPVQMTGINTYYDSAKGITNVSGKLSAWADQSGNSFSATQSTAGLRPTIIANSFATGIDGIRGFADPTNGNDQSLMSDSGGFAHQSPYTYFAVMKTTGTKATSTANAAVSTPMGIFGGSGWAGFGMANGSADFQVFTNAAPFGQQGAGLNDGNPHLIGVSCDATPNLRIRLGASQIGPTKTPGNVYTYTDHLFSGYLGTQDGFPGDVGALVTLTSTPADADVLKLDAWAQQRYGTDANTSPFAFLSLTELHHGPYVAAPWAGQISSGPSAGRDATTASSDPTPGTALNGIAPAHFAAASSQKLVASVHNDVLFSAGAGSLFVLFKATTAPAPSGAPYGDGTFLSDPSNAETTFGFTTSGICAAVYSSGYVRVDVACGTGAWHLAQFKWDGTNLSARVDSGSWTHTACGAWTPVTPGTVQIGRSYTSMFFDGDIELWATADSAISDADFDNIVAEVNATYGLSL